MLKRKIMLVVFFALCLLHTVYIGAAGILPYDPWSDINDDGIIDIEDLSDVSLRLWEEATPINKTELLLELQSKIDSLNGTLEARIPKIGYISIPAAAFVPENNTWDKTLQLGDSIYNYGGDIAYFYAPVQLPHGANVTKLTSYWYDNASQVMDCRLQRMNQTHNMFMAIAPSIGGSGYGNLSFTAIEHATVDNSKYAYYMYVRIPSSFSHVDYIFQYAVIEYEYPA